MKLHCLLLLLPLTLTACFDDGKNPLEELTPEQAFEKIGRLTNKTSRHCAKEWAAGEEGNSNCDAERERLAEASNRANPEMVLDADDLLHPPLWAYYNDKVSSFNSKYGH